MLAAEDRGIKWAACGPGNWCSTQDWHDAAECDGECMSYRSSWHGATAAKARVSLTELRHDKAKVQELAEELWNDSIGVRREWTWA